MKKIVSVGEHKVFVHLDVINSVDIRLTHKLDDGVDYPKYIVMINGGQDYFLYDGDRLLAERKNMDLHKKELEEHVEISKKMEEEGKTKEEIATYLSSIRNDYVDWVEYIIDSNKLQDVLQKGIKAL